MKLKTVEIDGKNYAEINDGKPVYTDDNGKEIAFDAVHTTNTITRLNGEAQSHREAKEKAEKALKVFEGIEDPEKARKALEIVAALDSKELIQAGKVDEIKAAATKAVEEQYAEKIRALGDKLEATEGERDGLRNSLHNELIGGNFARSQFVTDALAIPPDMVQSYFGRHFKVEENRVAAYDQNGTKIYSKQRPGEPAGFDEALEILVESYPHKDHILKGRNQNGGGASDGAPSSGRKMTKAQFGQLDPKTRAAKMAEPGFQLVD